MGAGSGCKLLFITDSLSGHQLLVDSGAQCSYWLPAQAMDTMADRHGPQMDTADGTPIHTYGTRQVDVCFDGRHFSWDFVMAAVSTPLLGSDFLCAFNLLVDVKNCCLIDAVSFASYPCTLGGQEHSACQTCLPPETSINACSPCFLTSPCPNVGSAVYARDRRLDSAKLAIVREEFSTMECLGIMRCSNSLWASTLHMLTKADGGWCLCGDFRCLN